MFSHMFVMVKFIVKRTQVSRRTGLWWIYRLNSRSSDPLVLRVEFLLETDSGYLRDAEVTLFTLAKPEHSLRFNTHWSAPPVSAFAHSGGPRKMSQSPVSRNSNIERRMDRPRAVVGVIRGVAETVDVSCLLWAGSDIHGVRYLRAIGYFSMSQCATGPARESKVCPRRSRMEG